MIFIRVKAQHITRVNTIFHLLPFERISFVMDDDCGSGILGPAPIFFTTAVPAVRFRAMPAARRKNALTFLLIFSKKFRLFL